MSMNRRSFFTMLATAPATLPAAAAVAQSPAPANDSGVAIARRARLTDLWSKDIVRRALIRIGVLAPGQFPSQADEEHGLATLTDLLAAMRKTNESPFLLERYHLIDTLATRLQPEFPGTRSSKSSPYQIQIQYPNGQCKCGCHTFIHKDYETGMTYLTCVNAACDQFDIPLHIPTIEAQPFTDRAILDRVRIRELQEEWAREREWAERLFEGKVIRPYTGRLG